MQTSCIYQSYTYNIHIKKTCFPDELLKKRTTAQQVTDEFNASKPNKVGTITVHHALYSIGYHGRVSKKSLF